MGKRIYELQKWVTRNPLLVWWSVFIPVLLLLLCLTKEDLSIAEEVLANTSLSFQYKVINFTSLVIVLRITLITLCVVVLIICLLFPAFRVSREGVQWTKELAERLTEASSEITAEEVGLLIREEAGRWDTVLRWLEVDYGDYNSLLQDLLFSLWGTFPEHQISMTLTKGGKTQTILHPLLPWLITENAAQKEETIGFKISFSGVTQLILMIYPRDEEGFSLIDESYLMILGQIFSRIIKDKSIHLTQLLSNFQVEDLFNLEC